MDHAVTPAAGPATQDVVAVSAVLLPPLLEIPQSSPDLSLFNSVFKI